MTLHAPSLHPPAPQYQQTDCTHGHMGWSECGLAPANNCSGPGAVEMQPPQCAVCARAGSSRMRAASCTASDKPPPPPFPASAAALLVKMCLLSPDTPHTRRLLRIQANPQSDHSRRHDSGCASHMCPHLLHIAHVCPGPVWSHNATPCLQGAAMLVQFPHWTEGSASVPQPKRPTVNGPQCCRVKVGNTPTHRQAVGAERHTLHLPRLQHARGRSVLATQDISHAGRA